MELLAPAFKIAGIAIGSEFLSKAMEEYGHGDKTIFVRIVSYVACGYIALDFWWAGVKQVAVQFGVSI